MKARRALGDATERLVRTGVLLALAVVYFWLVFRFGTTGDETSVMAIGVLLSQCSIVSILAGVGTWSRPVCTIAPFVIGAATWFGLSRIIVWGLSEPAAIWWAIEIAIQVSIGYIAAAGLHRKGVGIMRCIHPPDLTGLKTLQFPIRKLISLTTIASVLFAVISIGVRKGYLSVESVQPVECMVMAIVGMVLGTIGILSFCATLPWRLIHVAMATAAVLVTTVLIAVGLQFVIYWAELDDSAQPAMTILLLLTHGITTGISLALVLRIPNDRIRDHQRSVGNESDQEPANPVTNGVTSVS